MWLSGIAVGMQKKPDFFLKVTMLAVSIKSSKEAIKGESFLRVLYNLMVLN